jgi:hypothetical protein
MTTMMTLQTKFPKTDMYTVATPSPTVCASFTRRAHCQEAILDPMQLNATRCAPLDPESGDFQDATSEQARHSHHGSYDLSWTYLGC